MSFYVRPIKCLSRSLIGLGCLISFHAIASNLNHTDKNKDITNNSWIATASMGYNNFQNMYQNDGQTVLGRLALGKQLYFKNNLGFGLELGIQNGNNNMRLPVSQSQLNSLGGVSIQTTLKPVIDLLVTLKTKNIANTAFYSLLKGGIAYRDWEFDRSSISDQEQISGEIQAGFGLPISDRVDLNLLYQGIFGASPNFTVDSTTHTGHVSTMPIQQGVLLGLSVKI